MASDVVDDKEWQLMLAEFNQHFWLRRVPAFAKAWAACSALDPSLWSDELKQAIHGLAGVSALIGQDALGDLARHIEQLWDSEGASLPPKVQELADRLAIAECEYAAKTGSG